MLLSAALVVGLAVPAVSAAAASAPLLALAAPTTLLDYQSGNFSQWSEQQLARSAQQAIVTTPKRAGYARAARFTVRPGDYTNGGTSAERSEVMASVARTGNPKEGQTQWFSWSSFFPTGTHVSPGGWLLFTQWHQSGNSGSPNIALELTKTTPVQVVARVRGQSASSPRTTEKLLGALPTNRWVDFSVGVKWSSNPAVGHVTIKMNGSQVMNAPAATLYAGMSVYLKQGIYRMASRETQTIYDTATRIGATEASVKLATSTPVAPRVPVTRLSDFNRDGFTDLVTRSAAGTLSLYPGNGAGGFLSRRQMGSGWNGMSAIVTPGDVTGDGIADIIAKDALGRLWLYAGNGASAITRGRQIGSGWGSFTITNAANLNGSGRPDLLGRDSAGRLWLYPLTGNAVFGARTLIGTGWQGYTIQGPGDVSGDARADILARASNGSLMLFRGNGAGRFAAGTQFASGWQTMTALVTPGNWNRASGNDVLARDTAGRLWLYPGNNASSFLARRQIGSGWQGMTYIG